jgi:hypothetical protein
MIVDALRSHGRAGAPVGEFVVTVMSRVSVMLHDQSRHNKTRTVDILAGKSPAQLSLEDGKHQEREHTLVAHTKTDRISNAVTLAADFRLRSNRLGRNGALRQGRVPWSLRRRLLLRRNTRKGRAAFCETSSLFCDPVRETALTAMSEHSFRPAFAGTIN